MRILALTGALCALAFGTASAFAAGPSGKYAFVSTTFCEAKLVVTKDGNGKVTDVTTTQPGMMSGETGFITFANGHATVTGAVLIEGGAVRVGNNGFAWHQKTDNTPSTPYSFTATTFTYGSQVYQYVGSNTVGGIVKNVYLMRRDSVPGNPNCVSTISATKL